ncbi:PH domain-containing protein [Streptomyces physcomitrii]|uniref:PH domain-containing protein n=1 Tax=Streptomyces physcomitrii TaxID=2724184 RepID=A0ABX1GWK2_9ACTN|nr:PH domain-containing protein [Streptomyces physcomitrii]NKI40464.1 PH domain-containing protein [Streptomyces physcomitrii]
MTSPDPQSPAPGSDGDPQYKDRVYRSPGGIAGGVLLLALAAWLGIDALIRGEGRVPWMTLAAVLLVVPLLVAFTVRPAIFANDDRMRIRNPFRVITLPWSQVAVLRAGYSNEVLDESGRKYQMWALPVSLRARKRAASRQEKAARGGSGRGAGPAPRGAEPVQDHRASSDRAMDELRELQEKGASAPGAQGPVEVRWAYEILGPAGAGALLLVILLLVG